MSVFIDCCSQSQANRPIQADATKSQVELLLSQIAPQFLKNEFAESQTRIVTQEAPQQFYPTPNTPQNIINAIASELKTKISNIYDLYTRLGIWA